MTSESKKPAERHWLSFPTRYTLPTILAGAALLALIVANPADSQIGEHVRKAPDVAAKAAPAKARPKAPVQVELPPPPPMKIFPGLVEPLVATGPVTEEESKDLDATLKEYHDSPAKAAAGADYDDYAKPLYDFIKAHPQSNWNAAIHADIGFGFYHAGYYTRAFAELEEAWKLGKDATSPPARLLFDKAVGELAKMHASIGHTKELQDVIAQIGTRPMGGPGAQMLQGAQEALWSFQNRPEVSYLCGPSALGNVLLALKANPEQLKVAAEAKSGPHGVSLPELAALADKAKLKYRLIHREPGQPVPVPSVVNWKQHHYAAITDSVEGYYLVADPTFAEGADGARSQKTIDAESSGYFLVPMSVITANPKAGWRTVDAKSDEAKAVYGMGLGSSIIEQGNTPQDPKPPGKSPCCPGFPPDTKPEGKPCCCCEKGMTSASWQPLTLSLHLQDTPVGYKPQIGLPNTDTISYNSREAYQPAVFSFSNLSAAWAHGWQAYIVDNPQQANILPLRIAGGGGGYNYPSGFCSVGTGICAPETPDNSRLNRNPASGALTSWTRKLPDGSIETYGLSNGATTYPRYLFLTQITDPQGNATTISYDGTFRITSITDAMGRSTTFTYGLTSYPLLITQITDPFSRTAQITYDTSQRLSTITDPVGITSSFTYSTTQPTFVTNLATPYGTSTFSNTVNPNDSPAAGSVQRSLTLTDPLGYTDYIYLYQNSSVTPSSDPSGTIPAGMSGIANSNLQWRNTYYWNKYQFAQGVTTSGGVVQSEDFTKAAFTHWFHYGTFGQAVYAQISSVKQPLENRYWFNMRNTYVGYFNGSLDQPTQSGRVLDNGNTQLVTTTYPLLAGPASDTAAPWPLTKTDALGRVTKYTYATGNIDLLTVQQLTTTPSTYTTIATFGSYNSKHEPQTYTDAAGKVWNYTYNAVGQLATVTDPNSGVITYNYDGTGRLSTVVNANSQTVLTLTYDSADRIATRTDSQGYVLTYAYDNLDRITSITYPDSTTDLYDYDFQSGTYAGTASMELRVHTDRLGRATTYDYDAGQRLTSVTEPTAGGGARTTSYSYYEDGSLKEITDANGNVTHWDIDIQSRPTSKTYAYGTGSAKTETYAYETTTSRLKSITDALGQVKTFTYADDDRITGITYTNVVNSTPNVTFSWDARWPRLTSMADGLGTTSYSYTAVGTNGALKLSSIDGPYSNDTIGLTYDALGRLSGRNITGGNETLGYDAISRLTSHSTPLGSFTYGYLGETGQITSQSVTNGSVTVSTSWGYDTNTNDRRLTSITNSGVTRSFTLGYGSGPVNVYDIMSITDTAASGHPWATQSHGYTYDDVDRLLTATATTPGNNTYVYDDLDNATTVTDSVGTTNPTYNVNNQLATWGGNTYAYDDNGNTLSGDGVKTYKWDADNRLIEIDYVGTSNKTVFSYDGLSHKTVVAETVGGTTTSTRYLWCGPFICQSRNSSDAVLKRYLDEGEYNNATSQKLVYMPDQAHSVRDVIDATTGTRVASYDYSPYGALTQSSITNGTDYHYAGLFLHSSSGLNLATYRDQDGITGRWLNRDPIGETGGVNLYGYVAADPIRWTDSSGHAVGDLPPEPPGYDPKTWKQGQWPNGKPYLQKPNGDTYTMSPEDQGHWRHWDVQDKHGKSIGRCPEKSLKPFPTQKRLPYGNQSPVDPSGNAPSWSPTSQGTPAAPIVLPPYRGTPPVFIPPMISPCLMAPDFCNPGTT